MKRSLLLATVLLAAAPAFAQISHSGAMSEQTVRVGGQAMFPSKTIVANAVNSADHTTLVAAVKAAGLTVDAMRGSRHVRLRLRSVINLYAARIEVDGRLAIAPRGTTCESCGSCC